MSVLGLTQHIARMSWNHWSSRYRLHRRDWLEAETANQKGRAAYEMSRCLVKLGGGEPDARVWSELDRKERQFWSDAMPPGMLSGSLIADKDYGARQS